MLLTQLCEKFTIIINKLKSNNLFYSSTVSIFGKDYKLGAFIEAGYDIFFNEIIEYDITNEELARFWKK